MPNRIRSHVALAVIGAAALLTNTASAQYATPACCTVVSVDARTGVAVAKVTATGATFEFRARTPRALALVRAGRAVYADFAGNQVSLDGRSAFGVITKAPPAVAAAPVVRPPQRAAPDKAVPAAAAVSVPRASLTLPKITYGDPVPAANVPVKLGLAAGHELRTVDARINGRSVSARVLHVNGPNGVRNAPIPDGARRLLEMHMRKLPQGASHYYLIDPQAAAAWIATHPVPPEIKPKEPPSDDSDCGELSINGVVDCGEDAAASIAAEYERARKFAENWWDESTEDLAKAWNETQSCFADHTLQGPRTPVKFAIAPTMSLDMQQSGSRGGAQGTVKGTATIGIPMDADFQAEVDFFYIPCLPFAFRPKSLAADGALTVGQRLTLDVEATGTFSKRFTIPPTGGPQIPLYVIPIIIGNVPVAVLDVSAYIEGDVEVDANGKATGRFALTNSHRSDFGFECSGDGCKGNSKGSASPATTNESAQIDGQVSIKPGIYTALQLSLNYNMLSARAGPQPFLLGTANGCGAVQATQTGGTSSTEHNVVLTADLDWGVELRAEALAGGQRIGNRWQQSVMRDRHIWFRDLAPGGSTALAATVEAASPAVASQPARYTVRMPSCYPYTDRVTYQVTWTGGATPVAMPSSACQWQSGRGTCTFDPNKDLAMSLTWPSAGAFAVSVALVKDSHRTFSPAPAPTQVRVTVAP